MTIEDLKEKLRAPIVWGNCLGLVVATIALLVGAAFYLDSYTLHGENLQMPDVKGLDANVAVKKLEMMALRAEVSDTDYVANRPAGIILEQSIEPGREVKRDRLVLLTVNSMNSPLVAIPDLADNCSLREAEMKLKNLGFKIGVHELVPGDQDWVFGVKVKGRSVSSGTRVPAGSAVTLVVGEGYGDSHADIPEMQNTDAEAETSSETLSLDAIGV